MRRKRWDVYIDPDLLDRIQRHIGAAPVSNMVRRALEHWLAKLEEDEGHEQPGSTSPPATLATPPTAVDPVAAADALALARAFLAEDFDGAQRLATDLGASPARRARPTAPPAREDAEARLAIRDCLD